MRWGIIVPFLTRLSEQTGKNFLVALTNLDFAMLVGSIVLVAAGGYLHNDIMDQSVDEINKPGKNIVGELLEEKKARSLYYLITTVGLALAYYLANKLGNAHLSMIQLVMAVSLWFYSVQFKYSFLAGNLIIAFLIGLVPISVGIYEVPALYPKNMDQVFELGNGFNFNFLSYWTLGFGAFAFLFSLAREITKDIEDAEGDEVAGAQTLPIYLGETKAKYCVVGVYTMIAIALIYLHRLYLPDTITLGYMIVLLLGIGYVAWLTLKADNKVAFHKAGNANKLISFIGTLYAVVVAVMLYNQWI